MIDLSRFKEQAVQSLNELDDSFIKNLDAESIKHLENATQYSLFYLIGNELV